MNYFFQSRLVRAGTNKRFWKVWAPLSIIGFFAIYFAFNLLENVVAERLDRKVQIAATTIQNRINDHLERVYVDLDFIGKSQITQSLLEQPYSKEKLQKINAFFRTMSETHKIYDQIRLLSPTGQELARVNYNAGSPEIISPDKLQNKSERYYFIEAAKLPAGKVYVSPIDLNIEDGQIEKPYKPVIRFARPLYDQNGKLQAVLILNYLGDILLNNFRTELTSISGDRMLLNKDGFWLSNDVRSKEWGFMFNNPNSFAKDYSAAWDTVKQQRQGTLDGEDERIDFVTLSPLNDAYSDITGQNHKISDWKMVVINQDHRMGLPFFTEHMTYLYPLLLAYPLGSILLWFWARADSGREVAEQELIALNRSLEKKVHRRTAELEATKDATILSLATLAETRDSETGQHIYRTQHYIKTLADELKKHPDFNTQLSDASIEQIYKSAPLHDVGKVGIPDNILLKPDRLADDEYERMKRHTTLGSDAIEEAINSLSTSLSIEDGSGTFLHYARDIAHYHHERWDGKGYPKGLIGDSIPLAARLMAIADVYDALVSERVYKEAYSREKAEDIILNQSHGQFDPRILAAFEQVKDQFWQIKLHYSDPV
ncbi:HD domain-containing phosphohydrolase [Neptuniibacter sp.]|uniref:HD domain-containing phosphohydrolase n=1 Tax=Neptuniibacter sp. TaxID=1962643 RepID=UPI00261F94AA|nr:HD domain-containing phosphohydrolase [Neptuniibacter sp.]MCP4597360.1 HD domain-containing protein [Neptuniibacter sp.]